MLKDGLAFGKTSKSRTARRCYYFRMTPRRTFPTCLALAVLVLAFGNALAQPAGFTDSVKLAGREVGSSARQGGHAVAHAGRSVGSALRSLGHTIARAAKSGAHDITRPLK
jgi:hypothetical protein